MSEWHIEYLNEEQIFEKPDYGVKFIIPPSSVEVGQEVITNVKLVAPEESEIILPPDVELISCLYKIETKGKFSKSIELHLQHNIKIRSQEESQELAFITAEGPPPYKFELDINREFKPNKISGVIKVSDFIVVGAVKQKLESALCQQLSSSYAITVFYKHILKSSWAIQAVITKSLGPIFKVQLCKILKMLTKIVLSLHNFYLVVYILYCYSVLESEHRERF